VLAVGGYLREELAEHLGLPPRQVPAGFPVHVVDLVGDLERLGSRSASQDRIGIGAGHAGLPPQRPEQSRPARSARAVLDTPISVFSLLGLALLLAPV